MNPIRTLLTESIDYAGLFPPAGLDMTTAVENYTRYRAGTDAWALGRFVLPVSRLREFEASFARSVSDNRSSEPWRLALLAGPDLTGDLEMAAAFNRRHHAGAPALVADTMEIKAPSVRIIEDILRQIPPNLQAYVEVPIDRDPRDLILALRRLGGRAKVRTGGITRDAFPTTTDLLRFLRSCVQAGLAFKATAGLHHPLRAEYRLTYASDSPAGEMFGFLNLFLTTALLKAGLDGIDAAGLLGERSPDAIQLDDHGISWRNHRLDLAVLDRSRQEGMISFGSCSFTEPLSDLEALQLLPRRVGQS